MVALQHPGFGRVKLFFTICTTLAFRTASSGRYLPLDDSLAAG